MFNTTMGNDKFVKSLREYLTEYTDKTAVTANLFDSFATNWNYPQQNITEFMRSWTYQPGFPYLNITFNSQDKTYSVIQERFLQNGAKPQKDYTYVVPFSYYTRNSNTKRLLPSSVQFLSSKETKLPSEFGNFVKVNPAFNNFYLVNYPENYWKELSDKMLSDPDLVESMMVNDRADLLISSFLLARAKLTPYLTPFRLFNYMVNEKHFVPWYFYDYAMTYLAIQIHHTEYRESFFQFERRLTKPHYTGIEFWDDTQGTNLDKSFRQLLITITCRSGNQLCLENAYSKFSSWKQSSESDQINTSFLPPNLRVNILCYGVRASTNKSDYEFVWEKFKQEKDSSPLKLIYLQALTYITDSEIMKQ